MTRKFSYAEASKNLVQWLDSLSNVTRDRIEQAQNILNDSNEHPMGAPSRESGAELVLREIGNKIDEVLCAYDMLLNSINMPSQYKKYYENN
ncbi:MAG: hypothetical protein AB1775_10805 [Bacteroidota bacterium]